MRIARNSFLLLYLVLLARPLLAQHGRAYWDADADALKRTLTRQLPDTARLRTLKHLVDLSDDADSSARLLEQVVVLATRLHRPEGRPYRLWLAGTRLSPPNAPPDSAAVTAARDSLQTAIELFDALRTPNSVLLGYLQSFFRNLHQPEVRQAYYLKKLAYYKQQRDAENVATCYHALAGYYAGKGDYSRSISYLLTAAELVRGHNTAFYNNELNVVATEYMRWGNYAKALFYFRQALPHADASTRNFLYCYLARLYLRQHQYPAALHAANQALWAAQDPTDPWPAHDKTYALTLKSDVLLRLHQPAAAGRLLPVAQHLKDSLHIGLLNSHGELELDATWARYYAAVGQPKLAEAAWHRAYGEAQRDRAIPLQLSYLRGMAAFYSAQGQFAPATRAALAAGQLADTLAAVQSRFYVSYYEQQAVERRQSARIAGLRRGQQQAARRATRQRTALAWLLGGMGLLALAAGMQWRSHRRQQRANAQLAHQNELLGQQKHQIEEQANRLGVLDAAKNQFFANVSHELRTPLTLVLGPLDGLLMAPPAPLPDAVRGPVALAHRSARRLVELVNRILDLTKLEAGRLELRPAPTALAPLLRRVVAQFESLAAERRVALVAPAALPAGLRLLLDADKVEQILTNLLINALNHTPAGGAVVVSAALPAPDGRYELTVRDTGPGIAAGEQARVFERFYQSPQRQAQGGTGLGLPLSRELAALLGGNLTLASEPGQGAAFTLRFPATELGAESEEVRAEEDATEKSEETAVKAQLEADKSIVVSSPAAHHAAPNSPKPRVLVVEDQPDLRDYLRTLLAPAYEVLTATDGQDALDVLAREAPVDLLTTDAMMPRLSGTELLARLKADPARAGLPVLMLTARADAGHREAALTVGVDDYLTKPFVPAELLARVQALLARHAVRRQFAALPAEAAAAAPTEAQPAPANRAAGAATTQLAAPTVAPRAPGEVVSAAAAFTAAAQLAQWQTQLASHLPNPDFGPTELAALLCLSERTLYRRLGELAGLTPAAWLRELRLDHARRLLEAGGFGSVAEVAEAVGFANAKSFGARYAERFGQRPSNYRR